MEQERRVVLVDYSGAALSRQEAALLEAGYRLQRTTTLSAALGAVGPEGVEYLLLAPGLPAGDRRRIEGEAKRRRRSTRIVLYHDNAPTRDVFATAVLDAASSGDELLAALAD